MKTLNILDTATFYHWVVVFFEKIKRLNTENRAYENN